MDQRSIKSHQATGKLALDPYHYTLSLLQRSQELALLDESHLHIIYQQFMDLLREWIIKYCQGNSSSVKIETAERLMLSILYCVDAYISSLNNPQRAFELLKTVGVKEIHQKGLEMVNRSWQDTKSLYRKLVKLDIHNEAYQATVYEALPDSIQHYDPEFAAHDIMGGGSIDYPLLFDDMKVEGILYIRNYLNTLTFENRFCQHFNLNDINQLLSDYGQLYQIDHKEALVNVFEIVLGNAIFSLMAGKSPLEIRITPMQYHVIRDKLMGLDDCSCRCQIEEAVESLLVQLKIQKQDEKGYIRKYLTVLMPRVLSALKNDSLHNLVIIEREAEDTQEIIFDAGKMMNNEDFCALLEAIQDASDPWLRAQVIIKGSSSLGDFIDVLESGYLYQEDYHTLFGKLGNMELALLAKLIFVEEIRVEASSFDLYSASVHKDAYLEWQKQYCRFIQSLSKDQRDRIEGLISAQLVYPQKII
jgi:hypothetical protein